MELKGLPVFKCVVHPTCRSELAKFSTIKTGSRCGVLNFRSYVGELILMSVLGVKKTECRYIFQKLS